jgi:hypothetical protein
MAQNARKGPENGQNAIVPPKLLTGEEFELTGACVSG